MFTRDELLRSETYYTTQTQLKLFRAVEDYLAAENLTRAEFAEKLGVSKGRVSQILNGDFNGRLDRLVALSLAAGKAPVIEFRDLEAYIAEDTRERDRTRPVTVHKSTAGHLKAETIDELLASVESAHGVGFVAGRYATMSVYASTAGRQQDAPDAINRLAYV